MAYNATLFDTVTDYGSPAGEYVVEVVYNNRTLYSEPFTVDYTEKKATVDSVTISGEQGETIASTDITVTLTGYTFATALSGNWITNLPAGLVQSVTKVSDTKAKITISGTPTALSDQFVEITIPKANITGLASDLTVESNSDAKFNIVAPLKKVLYPKVKDIEYNGKPQSGVEEGEGYTLANHIATNAGEYKATATLESGYKWSDGYTERSRIVKWTIKKRTAKAEDFIFTPPSNLVYDNSGKRPSVKIKDEFNYTRKQSLSNAERFVTPELKDMENKILSAQDRIAALEYEIFTQVRQYIKGYVHEIQDVAKIVARIDVFSTFADVSSYNRYVRPTFNDDHIIQIEEGRHPVVEKVIPEESYVKNDISLGQDARIMLITGPNMGGKSTYMRQMALIMIMAQIGCFVPAKSATLPVFDAIFTRIGASDDLISGQSTFMVEMLEANNALKYATENSLIIFDEIGRGTATFDGMALAQGILEYIASHNHSLTFFSTHYHELTRMEGTSIKNVHAGADVSSDSIHFLYHIEDGPSGQSYGINVAKLAKLPDEVIVRADAILKSLEDNNIEEKLQNIEVTPVIKTSAVEETLKGIDPMSLSPLDALSTLIELKKML